MGALPSVPGVVLVRHLDRPATWRGRADGDDVDVTVLVVGPDPDLRRAALAALLPLTGVGARSVTLCRDGVAVICPALDGRLLDDLPPLEPGHAVFVGTAVAQALARVHARGLTWGGNLSELLVADDGTVLMPLHDVAARRLAGARATAADDAAAVRALLTRRCPDLPPLPDDLAGLRRRLRRVARPRALVLAGSGLHPVPRRRWLIVATPVAVGAVAAVGWVSARHPNPAAAISANRTGTDVTDWAAVIDRIDRARVAAFVGAGPMTAADAPGSPALAADTATATALRAKAPRTVPPTPIVTTVAVVRAGTTSTVHVTDTLPAYDYRDAAGRSLGSVSPRGPHTWTVTLVSTSAGWRVQQVS
ncbi:MAG TPA: hypothetical protein VIJ71_01495 [Mycobacteriales bacterium]